MSSKKKNIYIYLSKVILVTLLIVLCVRTFLAESYTISSSAMDTSLQKGDKVLIDKTSYGIRLPMTILTVPFTFDNIFGYRSYTTLLEAPYKRIFERGVDRNDVVLFNNPTEIDKPLDKGSLIVSRCVALPGDMISVEKGSLFVDGVKHMFASDNMNEYIISQLYMSDIEEIMEEQNIPMRNLQHQSDTISLYLNKLEAFIIDEHLQDSISLNMKEDTTQNYRFTVPRRGKSVEINSLNLSLYEQIILLEQGSRAAIVEDRLLMNGKEQTSYAFEEDYYWMLSDNTKDALDSRSLGFIPSKSIIGKVRFIWYSLGDEGVRKDRCFTSVN